MGYQNGILYGWQFVNNGVAFYSSNTFSPETWPLSSPLGTYSTTRPIDDPIEIVFGTGACSNYKYIYTTAQRILRATSAPNDWTFTDIASSNPQLGLGGLPNLPSDTSGRASSFAMANQGSTTRLFYGNYNDHTSNPPHAYIWHSDDCGGTWTQYEFQIPIPGTQDTQCLNYVDCFHGREIHAIGVEPATGYIYVTVDTECDQNGQNCPGTQTLGLWRSTDGGTSFTHVSSLPPDHPSLDISPINFVFPAGSNQIFLESDGDSTLNIMPNNVPGGPLVSWDKVTEGAFQIAAPWPTPGPNPQPTPGWEGAGLAIALTSEQNIFTITKPERVPQPGTPPDFYGVWYFAPPAYTQPALLEKFSDDTGLDLLGRTIEVTDPSNSVTYLYNGNTRFVKPEFTGAHQTLSNLNVGGGYYETFFIGTDQHVHMLLNNTNTGAWGNHDLNSYAQAPTVTLPEPGSELSSLNLGYPYNETFFIGTDQHVHMLLNNLSTNSWGNHDLNFYAQSPTNILPAIGSALSSLNAGYPYFETLFIGTDHHVHMIFNNVSAGTWGNHDLNAYANTPSSIVPVVGSALSSVYLTSGNSETFFIGMDQHVHMLVNTSGSWANYDLNSMGNSPTNVLPAVWTQLAALDVGNGNSEVFFVGTDVHVHRLLNMNGAWENDDVNSLAQTPTNVLPMLASPLQAFNLPNGATATFFTGTDQQAHMLFYTGSGWGNYDISTYAQAPTNIIPAVRSPYSVINLGGGSSETFFIGADQHVHMLLGDVTTGAWANHDINSYAQAPTTTLPSVP
jgi:hypothetical protein